MKISCIIIEDEPLALERTAEYVSRLPALDLRATFTGPLAAAAYLKTQPVDLIFLDINLGEMSGVDLLENFPTNSAVIFTTAYEEYALKAFDLNAADYLLKPFTFERFAQAVGRVEAELAKSIRLAPDSTIFVKSGNHIENIVLRDILYIEGMGDYRLIYTGKKRVITPLTFTGLESQIPPGLICRVHRSYMIALDKIESVGKHSVTIGQKTIPISDTYKKQFFALIAAH